MVSGANASAPDYGYEYYLDYLDPAPVDERKLRAHKHAIAIAFWVSLAAFVLLLLLVLLCVSRSGPRRRGTTPSTSPPAPGVSAWTSPSAS